MSIRKLIGPTLFCLLVLLLITACSGQVSKQQPKTDQQALNVTQKIVRVKTNYSQNAVCQVIDTEGNIWFSVNGEGAYRFDGKTFTNFSTKAGLADLNISAIIQDKAGNMLFGTSKGIYKFEGKQIVPIPNTEGLHVLSLFEDSAGTLWIAAMNKGIYQLNGAKLVNILNTYEHPFYGPREEKFISDILEDKNGNIWFSSWNGGGVWKYDGKNFKNYLPDMAYYKTNQDKRQMGKKQTFTDITTLNNTFAQTEDNISDDMIFSMSLDKSGNVWFATRNHGACYFDGRKFKTFGAKQGLLSSNVYAILQDKNGNMWFTTDKEGVWYHNGKTMKNFREKDGLVNNSVMSILEDKQGNMWFGTRNYGISQYKNQTFKTFSDAR
jgi:ligand-binding sensor domain-containing protein